MAKKYEFDYNIFADNSPEKFTETCDAIELALPDAKKEKLLVDVDGTTIQVYLYKGKEAVVYDDYDVGAVYVLSEFDLSSVLTYTHKTAGTKNIVSE